MKLISLYVIMLPNDDQQNYSLNTTVLRMLILKEEKRVRVRHLDGQRTCTGAARRFRRLGKEFGGYGLPKNPLLPFAGPVPAARHDARQRHGGEFFDQPAPPALHQPPVTRRRLRREAGVARGASAADGAPCFACLGEEVVGLC